MKEDTVTDLEKGSLHKIPRPFLNNLDCEGDTNENNHCTDVSQTGNDACVRNLDKQ